MTIRDDVLEILRCLEAEGCLVTFGAGGVVVEGAHAAMSDRARAALATLEGRGAQLRRVLAEGGLSPEAHALIERQREALAVAVPEATCLHGHVRCAANVYRRPGAGHGTECGPCKSHRARISTEKARARARLAKAKARAAAAKAKAAASPKKHGPPPRERCVHGDHLLVPENCYTSKQTGRRRCRSCVRRRDRERRKRSRKNYQPAPAPTLFQEVER